MLAKDVMTTTVVSVTPDTEVREIARRLLEYHISAVPVLDDSGALIGIVSEGDLIHRVETGTERKPAWWLRAISMPEERAADFVKSHSRHARDVMTKEVVTASEDDTLSDIAALLERHRIKRVPIVRDGRVVGIVSRANIMQGLAALDLAPEATADDATLRSAVEAALKETGADDTYVSVIVKDGTVRLWGMVAAAAEKEALRVAAENVDGTHAVEDNISVMPAMVRVTMGAA